MGLRLFIFVKQIVFRLTLAFKKVLGDCEYHGLSSQNHKACRAKLLLRMQSLGAILWHF